MAATCSSGSSPAWPSAAPDRRLAEQEGAKEQRRAARHRRGKRPGQIREQMGHEEEATLLQEAGSWKSKAPPASAPVLSVTLAQTSREVGGCGAGREPLPRETSWDERHDAQSSRCQQSLKEGNIFCSCHSRAEGCSTAAKAPSSSGNFQPPLPEVDAGTCFK